MFVLKFDQPVETFLIEGLVFISNDGYCALIGYWNIFESYIWFGNNSERKETLDL